MMLYNQDQSMPCWLIGVEAELNSSGKAPEATPSVQCTRLPNSAKLC